LTEPGDGLFDKFAACREDVFRVCLGFSRNFVDAEDLCQDTFVLREYGGLSYEEMALTLKTKPGTVMSRLNRARRAVARIVEEEI
jgi:DNA-directed RNA polymerase specialized sigma24 family protein